MDSARAGRSTLRTTGLATRPAPRGGRRPVAVGATAAVVVAAAFTSPGRAAIAGSFAFLEFFTGVFSLVGLSITVMIGLAATDRLLLLIRHRILLQLVHRATAATAVVCLAIHVTTKLVEGHAHLWDPAIPFLASHRPIQVGLGTLAGYLMIVATWTGVTRASYAGSRQPGRWRVLHAGAYLAWLLALVHGLGAGRSAKPWVLVSYAVCVALVAMALLVRFFVTLSRRTHLAKAQTIRRLRPVGQPPAGADATPLATSVLIPSLGTEWTDTGPGGSNGPADRAAGDKLTQRVEAPPQASRASDYRPYRPLRADGPVSPPHPAPAPHPTPPGPHGQEPVRERSPGRPEPPPPHRAPPPTAAIRPRDDDTAHPEPTPHAAPPPPAAARRPDDTAEITDEEFWAYIRNEVGR